MAPPSLFTEELVEDLLASLQECPLITRLCRAERFPHVSTVYDWMDDPNKTLHWREDAPTFAEAFARARARGFDSMAEETIDIADDTRHDTTEITLKSGETIEAPNREWIMRTKVRVDARHWLLSRAQPRKFSEKHISAATDESVQTVRVLDLGTGPDRPEDVPAGMESRLLPEGAGSSTIGPGTPGLDAE